MAVRESSWKQDTYEFYSRTWSVESPRAIVCLVHGMGEHCARYDPVATRFNKEGFAVYAYDQIGHGRTQSKRGHTPGFDFLLESVSILISSAKSNHPGIPVFLYGHSMGGNVALNYIMRREHDLQGGIITSPWLTLALTPPAFQLLLAKIMIRIYPGYADHTKLDASAISRDEQEVKKYINDPLVHDYMTPGFFFAVHNGGQWVLDHPDELKTPVLLMHGTADRLTSFESSKSFAQKAPGLVTFKPWEGGYHELHNDIEREAVVQTMIDWMNSTLKS